LEDHGTILKYHNDLTECMNGGFEDFQAVEQLIVDTSRVQSAMGKDNIVYGLIIDHIMLNGVTLLPRALYSIRESLHGRRWTGDPFQTGNTVRGVLLASIGRREFAIERMEKATRNPITVTARGWSTVLAIPLYFLQGLGIISSWQTSRATGSLIFRIVSLLTFAAALAGPILAYLADRSSIEREVVRITKAASDRGTTNADPKAEHR
jgi:hypothetical protein